MSNPLDVLKNSLAMLQRHVSAKRDVLTTHLKNQQLISEADKAWLDNGEGNLVDEECVMDLLERVPDYKQWLHQLSPQDKLVVEKLQKVAAESTNVTGRKREALALPEMANKVTNKRTQSSVYWTRIILLLFADAAVTWMCRTTKISTWECENKGT